MKRFATRYLLLAAALLTRPVLSSTVDTLSIGDGASEKTHALNPGSSQRITGGLDAPALTLVPDAATPWQSAPIQFTLKVDPQKQNYLTARLWGSDKGEEAGRLLVEVDGKQLGYVGDGDYSVLNTSENESLCPGRFFYVTQPLPPALTQGKTSVSIRIVARGPVWTYGDTFEKFQKPFTSGSRGLYRFYAHTDPYFAPPAEEKQGTAPTPGLRPGPGEEVLEQARQQVINATSKLLAHDVTSFGKQTLADAVFLAEAYHTAWTPAYNNPKAIERIIQAGDQLALAFAKDEKTVTSTWAGAGPLGEAVMHVWPALKGRMDEKITVDGKAITRRDAWTRALKTGIDFWRTHRRAYTNQSMIVDGSIYTANRGLLLIDPKSALPEAKALRYVYESIGLEPWLGSDPGEEGSGEKDIPNANVHAPYGANYFQITRKGLSRELGFVGTYGETILRFAHDMVEWTGDPKIRQQLKKIAHARLYFRYPAQDADGYRTMKLSCEIDERKEHFPASGSAYADYQGSRENWAVNLAALMPEDPAILGVTQQCLEDHQFFPFLKDRLKSGDPLGLMRTVDDYAKVKALPPSKVRLPMTDGQPDFVYTDEENAVLALKDGDTKLYLNLYFRSENGVNRTARVFEVKPTIMRIATVRTEVEVNESGKSFTRPDHLQRIRPGGEKLTPPGVTSHQAWAGEVMPIAKRPDDATQPAYGAWGPFVGKASFYWLQYGDYLIGLNTTENQTFTLPTQSLGLTSARDLVSKKDLSLKEGVPVKPLTTVVLKVGNTL
jgi:hypothetical protein